MVHGRAELDDAHDWIVRVGLLTGFRELTPEIEERIRLLAKAGYTDRDAAELLRKQYGCSRFNTEGNL
jgi:hypothetical protein